MCSFPPSTFSSCALLKHSELVTLFHELGYGMHNLLWRARYVRFHRTNRPPDFAEAPSVMLENLTLHI
ncbi:peptidase M3A/M3B [Durotheca rogersii]|uniref:peptidase M3A/M3B n=1 Tax=Durotheca rogersii TaxID=419775 RepID=UPI002220A9FE|nr:peptidase M3A/M3B [Durotheca rogersii]KAI5865672.1 peptidase M3A/M3B [Durotheca rogersii]